MKKSIWSISLCKRDIIDNCHLERKHIYIIYIYIYIYMSQPLSESGKNTVNALGSSVAHAAAALEKTTKVVGQGVDAVGHGVEAVGKGAEAVGKGAEAVGNSVEALGDVSVASAKMVANVAAIGAAAAKFFASKAAAKAQQTKAKGKIQEDAMTAAHSDLVAAAAEVKKLQGRSNIDRATSKSEHTKTKAELVSLQEEATRKENEAKLRYHFSQRQYKLAEKEAILASKEEKHQTYQKIKKQSLADELERKAADAEDAISQQKQVDDGKRFIKKNLMNTAATTNTTYYESIKKQLTKLSNTTVDWDSSWKNPTGEYNPVYKQFDNAGFNMYKVENELLVAGNTPAIEQLSMILAICMAYTSNDELVEAQRKLSLTAGLPSLKQNYARRLYGFKASFRCADLTKLGFHINNLSINPAPSEELKKPPNPEGGTRKRNKKTKKRKTRKTRKCANKRKTKNRAKKRNHKTRKHPKK